MDVSPKKRNLETVFNNTQFKIDFYQRDYKWDEKPVNRLLGDVYSKFSQAYEEHSDLSPEQDLSEIIETKYPGYYLNTYVTNKVGEKVFIVDGQQRLTTLSLMAIALRHLGNENKINEDFVNWISRAIGDAAPTGQKFRVIHEGHEETQRAIYKDNVTPDLNSLGITSRNMIANFTIIKKFLTEQLDSKKKLEAFIFYFLKRLILVELLIDQTDVPMVFEVINDRGVKLAPYEILKGNLLGQIDKDVLDQKEYNKHWHRSVDLINEKDKDKKDTADNFFTNYLKAKFANTRNETKRFDKDYHREMLTHKFQEHLKSQGHLPLLKNQQGVQNFLDGPFKYFSKLYVQCLDGYNLGFSYNKAVGIDGASMLVLSSCSENDPEEQEKLKLIPLELDRLFLLLQLQGVNDNNTFQEILYRVSAGIREKPMEEIRPTFDSEMTKEFEKRRDTKDEVPFKYQYFDARGRLNLRVTRYFFARVEEFFAKHLGREMVHSIHNLTRNNGFHIEHILSKNTENIELFENEETFETERNRLGGLLLLKGKDNQSSGNEPFTKKLKTYSGCSLVWNETLTDNFAHSNNAFKDLKNNFDLPLRAMDKFGPEELEERQRMLFKIAEQIWK